jgi:hypothetical protein
MSLLGCFVKYQDREYWVCGGRKMICRGHPRDGIKEYQLCLPGPHVASFFVSAEELTFVCDPFSSDKEKK